MVQRQLTQQAKAQIAVARASLKTAEDAYQKQKAAAATTTTTATTSTDGSRDASVQAHDARAVNVATAGGDSAHQQ